jgi:hypothetical protein
MKRTAPRPTFDTPSHTIVIEPLVDATDRHVDADDARSTVPAPPVPRDSDDDDDRAAPA